MTAVIPASARLLVAVLSVALAAYLGSRATLPNIPTWYAGLAKPSFTPPNGVFGPVWAVLYAAMAVACWRVLSLAPGTPGRARALFLFFVQLALNAAWSFAFFGARSPTLGLLVIIPPPCLDRRNHLGLPPPRWPKRLAARAVPGLGRLRDRAERRHLAAQPVRMRRTGALISLRALRPSA